MALITRAAMEYPDIMRIVREPNFSGPSAVTDNPLHNVVQYAASVWRLPNELITLGPNYYAFATGLKTGFHDQAGNCVVATASKDGRDLIAVVLNASTEPRDNPERWFDARTLFEYGFNMFSRRKIEIDMKGTIYAADPPLSDLLEGRIEYAANADTTMLLSFNQFERIVKGEPIFNPDLIAPPSLNPETGRMDNTIKLRTPIFADQVIGTVTYMLDGVEILSAELISLDTVLERTPVGDWEHRLEEIKAAALSIQAIPLYLGILLFLIMIIVLARSSRKRKRDRSHGLSRRY
jgi:D-alanyl-D-alanine carboxypeptidase (penicillin-binding protein 5/6)